MSHDKESAKQLGDLFVPLRLIRSLDAEYFRLPSIELHKQNVKLAKGSDKILSLLTPLPHAYSK